MIILALLLMNAPAWATDGLDLRARVKYRTCQDVLAEGPFEPHFSTVASWMRARARTVHPELKPLIAHETQRTLSTPEAFERAFRVDGILAALAVARPFPFNDHRVEPAAWQIEVWPDPPKLRDSRVVILGDHLVVDPARGTVVAGEFAMAMRFDRRNRLRDLRGLIALAFDQTHLPKSALRGLVHDEWYGVDGQIYLILDIPGSPAERFQNTFALAVRINEELRELAIAEPRR